MPASEFVLYIYLCGETHYLVSAISREIKMKLVVMTLFRND